MAASSYDEALKRVLAHEGGYVNHPRDPGGPTKFGITIATYRRYVKTDANADDIRNMQLPQAKEIYRRGYWNVLRCDELPAGLDYAVFDYGVNSGNARATQALQHLLGFPADGRMSDEVIRQAKTRTPADLIVQLCDRRLAFMKSLKTWPTFGAGWERRVREVRRAALDMAGRANNRPAHHAKAVAAVVAGAGALPAAYFSGFEGWTIFASAIVVAAIALIGWLGFRAWQKAWRKR